MYYIYAAMNNNTVRKEVVNHSKYRNRSIKEEDVGYGGIWIYIKFCNFNTFYISKKKLHTVYLISPDFNDPPIQE